MQIVECVPNFSEGRDKSVIDMICDAITGVEGISLLDVDMGASTNRTVVTFVGPPDVIVDAAFAGVRKAAELIDMRHHKGAHPRMGATDVVPFVPVSGVTMEDCVALARKLGERVGEELGIPVYLYENAATRPERRSLASVREGEYEGLAKKLADPDWVPDFGPAKVNASAGATAIGAREFLIAYNVTLNTRRVAIARAMAERVRERGGYKRGKDLRRLRDQDGNYIKIPGKFKHVRAIGWYVDEYKAAQISINFTNYKLQPIHDVVEELRRIAPEYGAVVTGSELVGLIPKAALLEAGRYYLARQGASPGVPERDLVDVAVRSLGLNDLYRFDPAQKVVEYRVAPAYGELAGMRVADFVDEVSRDSAVPGGGSVAALSGAIAAALAGMVANLTVKKVKFLDRHPVMQDTAQKAQALKDRLMAAVDQDSAAYAEVMAAMKLPKSSPEEKAARLDAIAEATRKAAGVPFGVLSALPRVVDLAKLVAEQGNPASASDAGVAAAMAQAAAIGACMNVLINLAGDEDPGSRKQVSEALATRDRVIAGAQEVIDMVNRAVLPEAGDT